MRITQRTWRYGALASVGIGIAGAYFQYESCMTQCRNMPFLGLFSCGLFRPYCFTRWALPWAAVFLVLAALCLFLSWFLFRTPHQQPAAHSDMQAPPAPTPPPPPEARAESVQEQTVNPQQHEE